MPIKFGTDGWRGVVGEDFTYDNVRACAQGTANYLIEHNLATRGLVIGYDTRFASGDFAAAVAETSTANQVITLLCDRPAPTPVVSYNLVARHAGGGAIITASHNPPRWNGFKYKPSYGGSASPEIVAELEAHIAAAEGSEHPRLSLEKAQSSGLLKYFDPEPIYLDHVATLVDLNAIKTAGLRVVVDPMFGAAAGYFPKLLEGGSTRVTELHGESNPEFPGMSQPEPLAHNLEELISSIQKGNADVGLATDGDADRLGIVDEKGRFITTLQAFALLCLHQLEVLGNRGPLVRSITMTGMIDRLGKAYDVPVFDTPVGFKYLGPVMMRENALAAGEESGGYAFRGNIPERDGILSGLMVLEMIAKSGKSPSELLEMLTEKVGQHFYKRWDLEFEGSQRGSVLSRVQALHPPTLGGMRVVSIDTRDGIRFVLEGGHWVLIRFSGTEPLLRIYAEAGSHTEVTTLLGEARAMTGV